MKKKDVCKICKCAIHPIRRSLTPTTNHCGKPLCALKWRRMVSAAGMRRRRRELKKLT